MRRAIYFSLLVGALAGVACADDPLAYRGQTAAEWLRQLSHPVASARAAAAQAFVKIGKCDEAAGEPLIRLLSDRNEQVRFYAAYALGKIEGRPKQSIAALIKVLPDEGEHVRYAAQWSLARIAQQVTEATDSSCATDESIANLLREAETQLLVAGALPGHLRQVRAAIARLETPTPQQAPVDPPPVDPPLVDPPPVDPPPVDPPVNPPPSATSDEDDQIDRCLRAIASNDLHTKVKAMQALPTLGLEAVHRLIASPDVVDDLEPAGWYMSRALAGLGEPVVPVLTKAVQNPNDEVSNLAANALIELGPVARLALPELINLLDNPENPEAVRQRAIQVMIDMGAAAGDATDVLIRVLNDVEGDDWLQESAAEALGAIGPAAKGAIPALIDQLADADGSPYARAAIASALVRLDPKSNEVTEALVAAFHKSESTLDAIDIAERLCECGAGASAILPGLIEAIDATSFDERAAVLRILGQLGASHAEQVGPLLFECLMDPTEELMVRVAAAKALGELGSASVRPLIDELQYGDEASQLIAARALVEIGSAAIPAREALIEILVDRRADDELRSLAAIALGQLGAEARDAASVLTELLRDSDSDSYLRSMCAVALGQVDPAAAPTLESTLDDTNAEVQIAAAYSLCKMDSKHARGLAALMHWLESDEYRGSAINAIIDIGKVSLSQIVEKMNDTSQSRDTRIACLEVLSAFDDDAITPLLHALNDQELADEASWALRDRGNELVPTLLAGMEDEANFTPQARSIIRSVIEDMFSGLGGGDGDATWDGGHALVRRPEPFLMEMSVTRSGMASARRPTVYGSAVLEEMAMAPEPVENQGTAGDVEPVAESEAEIADSLQMPEGYKTVDVFYGTNRKPIEETSGAAGRTARWFWLAAVGVVLVVVIIHVGIYRRGAKRLAMAGLAGTTLILFLGLLLAPTFMRQPIDKSGPRYGGDYSNLVEMGVCQVTIPDTHREGELEAPTLLRFQLVEDLQKHIVLRSVQRMESEAFFAGLQKELQSKGNNILVFIHGYNVSFEDAARRTAQMSSDLKFAGAPVFYSWPSQADWWKYRVDEKNVELSVDQLKSFLLAVAERSRADTINLVAHSMGNRALTDALKEMDVAATGQRQLFNQVILAAPDIDADIFKQRIAPAIVAKAKHITLYASSKDLALVASRKFNSGDPRAGDAGENLVVVPGIETIDVTNGDSSLLGHSYYGDNVSVLRDIESLLRDRPAGSRQYLEPVSLQDDLIYWMFQPPRISRRIDESYESR